MMQRFWSGIFDPALLSHFRTSRRGNVAIIFGLSLAPALLLTGMSIDYMRAVAARAALQQALDATALALGREAASLGADELQTKATRFFSASFVSNESPAPAVTVEKEGSRIILRSALLVPTAVMQLVRQPSVTVRASATATFFGERLEIALVLDTTGSMSGSKISALKSTATAFIDQLAKSQPDIGDIRMSIVPYNEDVNVGVAQAKASWIKQPVPSGWTGCVDNRATAYKTNADPGGLYPPVLCNTPAEILPLTDMAASGAVSQLKTRIGQMSASGNTDITIGLVWGLATLSADGPLPGVGPRAFGEAGNRKILILLTDGVNTYGSDSDTLEACRNTKAKGVRIVTIRLIDGDATLLRSCASSSSDYFSASSESRLPPIFETILNGLQAVRLVN